MSNFQPQLPPGVRVNPPRWKFDTLHIDDPVNDLTVKGTTFGYGIGARHRRYRDVESTFGPGALVHGWWSWFFEVRFGARAWILYYWRETLAGV